MGGSVMTSIVLLFVIGSMSTRPTDAFWKNRPLKDCPSHVHSACWEKQYQNNTLIHDASAIICWNPQCDCPCDSGVWVAWGNWVVIFALIINVAQGWLTGVVIKQFSTVLRAIAQASTILVIYFIGDPLVGAGSVQNIALTLVAFSIPFSTSIFMVAASEMKKALELAMQRRERSLSNTIGEEVREEACT